MFVTVAMAAATVLMIVMHISSSLGLFAIIIPIGAMDVKTFIFLSDPPSGLAVAGKIRYNSVNCQKEREHT